MRIHRVKINRITLLSLIILSILNVESVECIENVGNRYGIETTIIDGVVTGPPPYTTQNTFCPTNCGQCTAFAWGRSLDRLGITTTFSLTSGRHACSWPDIITIQDSYIETDYTKPRANSFIIWGYDDLCNDNSTGHVAYIEEVDGDDVYINEANITTYTPGQYGGGYDGYTKKLTIAEINSRTGVGGPFKAYVYLDAPFSDYWYWDFDDQGTEDWNAREAISQGIYQNEYWQIGSSYEDNSTKRGIVSPVLNNLHTETYKQIEIRFSVNNIFLDKIEVFFKVNNNWSGPFNINWVSGTKVLGSQNLYRGNIPVTGQIQQVRFDFLEGSNSENIRIYIDKISFIKDGFNNTLRVPYDHGTIQSAIDSALNGYTVLVADGIYKGPGNKDIDFKGKAITLKSENGAEFTTIDCEYSGRGFYFHSGESQTSQLVGFTIKNGRISGNGGGIYCSNSSPTISNCIVTNNITADTGAANDDGGGIYCGYSSPIITNCKIINNVADDSGGGIFLFYSNPTIINCNISNNLGRWGGGILLRSSSPNINECLIEENQSNPYDGGGLYIYYGSTPTVTNCKISKNTSNWWGGGIHIDSASPNINNCIINGNYSGMYGGGISILSANFASEAIVSNCTITKNSANYGGGIVCYYPSDHNEIINSIVWLNTANYGSQISLNSLIYNHPSSLVVSYCSVEGGVSNVYLETGCTLNWGNGNLDSNPNFIDAQNDDYHLASNSPCINSGTFSESPISDYDGDYRPQGLKVDIGADEYNFSDFDEDRDIDGFDLTRYIYNQHGLNITEFASNFGRSANK